MTNEERKIYDMVVRRFLSVLYPPAVYEQVSMEGTAAGETFAASGRIIKVQGGERFMKAAGRMRMKRNPVIS